MERTYTEAAIDFADSYRRSIEALAPLGYDWWEIVEPCNFHGYDPCRCLAREDDDEAWDAWEDAYEDVSDAFDREAERAELAYFKAIW